MKNNKKAPMGLKKYFSFWLNGLMIVFLSFAPLMPAATATAEETTPPPPDCAAILNGQPALADIPQSCWSQITVDQAFCNSLFGTANNNQPGLEAMQNNFSAACTELAAGQNAAPADNPAPAGQDTAPAADQPTDPADQPAGDNLTSPDAQAGTAVPPAETGTTSTANTDPAQPLGQTSPENGNPPSDQTDTALTTDTEQQAAVSTTQTGSSDTGNNTANENDQSAAINTGDAASSGQIIDNINENTVTDSGPAPQNENSTDTPDTAIPNPQEINAPTAPADNTQIPQEPNPPALSDTPCAPEINNCNSQTAGTEQNAEVDNNVNIEANTGNNTANENSGQAEINTGDAQAIANVVNVVNTNVISSDTAQVVIDVADQFLGDINLLDILLNMLGSGSGLINSDVSQTANVENNINAQANTGGNSANGNDQQTTITTGNGQAAVNLVNLVNTTLEGSRVLISFVNILGDWLGNLIVPGQGVLPYGTHDTQVSAQTEQTATVSNDVVLTADSGNNTATGNDQDGQITSGQALALAAIYNQLNTTIIGDDLLYILPNIFGTWDGTTVNNPGGGLSYGVPLNDTVDGTTAVNSYATQTATILNIIRVSAITGNNTASDNGGAGNILTGKATALANIINIANTHLIGSNWTFAVINLMGNWKGNIIYAYPDLAISNSNGDHPENTVTAGDQVTYTLHFQNDGYAPANNLLIQDTYPAGTNFVSATDGGQVNNGAITWTKDQLSTKDGVQQVAFTVQVPEDFVAAGQTASVTNQVEIRTQTNELNLDNNKSGSTLQVVAKAVTPAATESSIVVAPAASGEAKIKLTKTNDATAAIAPGSEVTYTVTAASVGQAAINNLTLTDELKDSQGNIQFTKNWNFPSIDPGTNVSLTYSLQIPGDAADGIYTNTVNAAGDNIQPANASSSVSVKKSETPPAAVNPQPSMPRPHLAVNKTNSAGAAVEPGSKVSYKISIANDGNEAIKKVTANDTLTSDSTAGQIMPTKDWNFGDVQPGEVITITYDIAFSSQAPAGTYTNSVNVAGTAANGNNIAASAKSSVKIVRTKVLTTFAPAILGASTLIPAGLGNLGLDSSSTGSITGDPPAAAKMLLPWWALALAVLLLFVAYYIIYRRGHTPVKNRPAE